MRIARVLAAALAAALIPVSAALAAPALPLGHAGRWMTDAQGRVAILHGLNMVSKRAPYAPDAVGFGDDDAAFLAAEGYNTVRVGVILEAVEPTPGAYDDGYLDRIRATVDTLGRHGIVSLLDFHQDLYSERFQGEGWPDWAVIDDGLPAEPKSGFPNNYLVMPALQHAFDHFWANDPGVGGGDTMGLQDRYAAAWRHVAERFRDNANVMGYDLLNEPWPGTAWQECANPAGCPVFDAKLSAFNTRVIAAIREADPRTLAFYEPNVLFNNGPATHLADTGDPQAGMSFHDYCLTAENGGARANCDTQDDLVFVNADNHARETGDTLMLTEFGATPNPDVLGPMTDRADRFMVSWQEWHYCGCADPTTSGPGDKQAIVIDPAKPPAGANLDTGKLKLLSRPYPQLVAGTPGVYGFDAPTRTFTLGYSTRRADGTGAFGPDAETEIAVPARQYPTGYAAEVRGAHIASPPGAPVLRVAACPGATAVSVAVRPTGTSSSSCAAPVPARLRVTVSPRRLTRVGRRVTLRVRVLAVRSGASAPLPGAVVRVAGARAVTNRQGRATILKRFGRRGAFTLTATARGYVKGRALVLVVKRRTQAVGPSR